MRRREFIKLLEEHGYRLDRRCRHGEFYVKGSHKIMVARGSNLEPRAMKNNLSLLRKQLKEDEEIGVSA